VNKRVWSITVVLNEDDAWLHYETWANDGDDPVCRKGVVARASVVEGLLGLFDASREVSPCSSRFGELVLDESPF
jgi:hypothetical protein